MAPNINTMHMEKQNDCLHACLQCSRIHTPTRRTHICSHSHEHIHVQQREPTSKLPNFHLNPKHSLVCTYSCAPSTHYIYIYIGLVRNPLPMIWYIRQSSSLGKLKWPQNVHMLMFYPTIHHVGRRLLWTARVRNGENFRYNVTIK